MSIDDEPVVGAVVASDDELAISPMDLLMPVCIPFVS